MPTPLLKKWLSIPPPVRSRVEQQLGVLTEGHPFEFPQDTFTSYACTDAVVTYGVHDKLIQRVHGMGLDTVCAIDHAIIPMVVDMMSRGMRVNVPHFQMLDEGLLEMMSDQHKEINTWLPYTYGGLANPGSDDQVASLLFSVMHLPYLYLTDSGKRPSVDAETLEAIEHHSPVVGMILKWRELETLLTTYVRPLLARATQSPDHKIHPNILLTRQPTGRFSTKEPNLLAMPTRTAVGRLIREGFVPTPGYSFLSCDFSQLEARILAHMSKDKALCQVFHSGVDPFRATAGMILGCKPEDVTKIFRDVTKTVFYLLIYGGEAEGLSIRLRGQGLSEWTVSHTQNFINQFFKLYPQVPIYISNVHAEARSTGMVRDMWGRYRYVPQVRSTKKSVAKEGLRQAQNFPMQSGASGIMKRAMRIVWEDFKLNWQNEIWADLQIHDELLFEAKQGTEETWGVWICNLMCKAAELMVPLKAKYAYSTTDWGSIEK